MQIDSSEAPSKRAKKSTVPWKLLYGQVFRQPQYPVVFACLFGAGAQVFMMFYFTLNAFVFFFSSESLRPPVYTIIMAVLSIMGFVNGIMTMRLLKFFGLSDFIFSAAISSVGLPLFVYTCLAIEVVLNAKSGGYSTRSLWWSLASTIIWTFVNSAFCFAGAYKGYTMKRLEP